jgi:hypothetical protein
VTGSDRAYLGFMAVCGAVIGTLTYGLYGLLLGALVGTIIGWGMAPDPHKDPA